jgi:hypothetical protein
MSLTLERPPVEAPDAGVIEDARARQRRHRGVAAAVTLAAGVIAAILLGFAGGGSGSRPQIGSVPAGFAPSKTARLSPASCRGSGKALQRAPSRSLLSILGVLRRPATAADALPPDVRDNLIGTGFVRDVFVRYIRRTRVVSGSFFYIYPAILGECGTGQAPHEGIMDRATNVDLGHGLLGGVGGGGATAADIEQGRDVSTGPPGSSTSATITMIVPDGVARVTLHYPAGRASGYSPKISPPFTITTAAVNNEVVVRVPRTGGPEGVSGITMIWRSANRHVIKTFHRL